jgi:hypothetical protein
MQVRTSVLDPDRIRIQKPETEKEPGSGSRQDNGHTNIALSIARGHVGNVCRIIANLVELFPHSVLTILFTYLPGS